MHPCPLSDPKTDRFSGWSEEAGRVEDFFSAEKKPEKLIFGFRKAPLLFRKVLK
jgi:hypothetical protein